MGIEKLATGINGLDQVLSGGYPAHRSTLIQGGPGTGKTILAVFFLYKQLEKGDSSVFVTCDESPENILNHMRNFGLDVDKYLQQKKLNFVDLRPVLDQDIVGEYELSALLLRIQAVCQPESVIVIDSIQNLFLGLLPKDPRIELLRLLDWVHSQKLTALVTASATNAHFSMELFEEHSMDCVIGLNMLFSNNLMTRYLTVTKYRSSGHGTNQYPYSIQCDGIFLLPITATRLIGGVGASFLSTGIKRLDDMLGGEGIIENSVIMFSGTPGTGKTLFASRLGESLLQNNHRVLFVNFEETTEDLIRNVHSAGIDLQSFIDSGQLRVLSSRSVEMGLEEHIISIIKNVNEHQATGVIVDPLSSLADMGSYTDVKMLLIRFVNYLKNLGVTLVFTELLKSKKSNRYHLAVSSMADTWIMLRSLESSSEFNRLIHVVKSRGSATSNQVKEFIISGQGIQIEDPFVGEGGMVFGTEKRIRIKQEESKRAEIKAELVEIESMLEGLGDEYDAHKHLEDVEYTEKRIELEAKRKALMRFIQNAELRTEFSRKLRE